MEEKYSRFSLSCVLVLILLPELGLCSLVLDGNSETVLGEGRKIALLLCWTKEVTEG